MHEKAIGPIHQSLWRWLEFIRSRNSERESSGSDSNMGALYEDVEKFFGDIFAFYGRFLARYPIVFIVLSLLTCCLLGMGLVNVKYEKDVQKLYTPIGSPAFKDRVRLAEIFPDTTRDAYYPYQLIYHGVYGELIFVADEEHDNVLDERSITEIKTLRDRILDITLEGTERGLHYRDVCAMRNGECVVDGSQILDIIQRDGCYNKSIRYVDDRHGYGTDMRDIVSGITDDEDVKENGDLDDDDCLRAKVMRLRFNLKQDTTHQRDLSVLWENQFLLEIEKYNSPNNMDIAYSTSESLDTELASHLSKDTKFFSLTIVIMVVYAIFVSSGGNWVSTRMLLAQAGILAALLAILATFGLLSLCGMLFVDICGVMPFLVLDGFVRSGFCPGFRIAMLLARKGVGVDDMFILMSGWRQTDLKLSIEDRMSNTFRSSAISVTITSLTDLLAFCIGATSPFLAVKNFCIYAGVAVLFCYINQLTFFAGCMVLHARRVEASRHCITCLVTRPRKTLKEEGLSRFEVLCCSGEPPKHAGEDDSPCEKLPNTFLPRLLLMWPVKTIVIVLFIIYICVSIWGASNIKTGLKIEHVVPDSSYLSKYLLMEREYFQQNGPAVMFVVTDPIPYQDPEIREKIGDLLAKCRKSDFIDGEFTISWLERFYESGFEPATGEEMVSDLRDRFLIQFPQYETDLKFNDNEDLVVASRFYIRSKRLNDSVSEGSMMTTVRDLAVNSTLPIVVYSPEFIFYEHYVSILKNTLLSVGVAVIGMLFIALMFIPHPISITCVTITMVTIVLGMFGFMSFWNVELSSITNVQIVLSVGFSVDFTVHISHAFMTATGKNRNERVIAALEKVGIPILNGAFSSIVGVLILAFANSYVFRSFFKTMVLVITLGLGHSLLLLPVMLSFIGPRRTSKPRVFIPISNNWSTPAGIFGLGVGSRKHASPGEHGGDDVAESPEAARASQTASNGNLEMELMTLDTPDESKSLLHRAADDGDPEHHGSGSLAMSRRERTLLDKTPEDEHYRDPVEFADVQITLEAEPGLPRDGTRLDFRQFPSDDDSKGGDYPEEYESCNDTELPPLVSGISETGTDRK
ncbi:hypothetical protein LSH36_679g01017 [Paralvinella palmiformis]|uniref:SSD domain-containing protein n=1 Tax=Paralvinella palmiformis TaxID=53620 RepID=A0AAD9J4H4_9ANNE|nr:hypothetical protein LSH36_679g01017 [Paralvinella palmiformis]